MEPKPITVTIPTTRQISGLGNTTVWKLIAEKKLDTVRVGKRRLVLYASLERLLTPAAEQVMPSEDNPAAGISAARVGNRVVGRPLDSRAATSASRGATAPSRRGAARHRRSAR
jgi:hypothetical protein